MIPVRSLLEMVGHLHRVGYAHLRACWGEDHRGFWRVLITPAGNTFANGWLPRNADHTLIFRAEDSANLNGLEGFTHEDARSLAIRFLFAQRDYLRAAEGHDPAYVRWFRDRLDAGALSVFLVQRHGGNLSWCEHVPLPPSLPTEVTRFLDPQPMIATEALALTDLPLPDADYAELFPFALSIDGYLWSAITGYDLAEMAEKNDAAGIDSAPSLNELRVAGFYWQRCEKFSSSAWEAERYIANVRAVIDRIRRMLSDKPVGSSRSVRE